MAVHMRSQLFFIRPQVAKFSTRSMPVVNKAVSSSRAIVARLPARSMQQTTRIATIGAILSASVAALTNDDTDALCQDALSAEVTGPSGGGKPEKKDDAVEKFIDQVMSQCGEITLAGTLGFCSGYALKQLGKVAAIAVGVVFLMAQGAAYKGYININWGKVEKDAIAAVDPNGDGKLTKEDVHMWYKRLMATLKHNLPSSAGFSSGFALGIYYS